MIKKLLKSVVGLLIAFALLALGVTFGFMAMAANGMPQLYIAFVSLSFMFLFFRWLVFLVHKQ